MPFTEENLDFREIKSLKGKERERCKEMACTESLQRTVFIRELIWKDIECKIAA
jgi:hypothetical protein